MKPGLKFAGKLFNRNSIRKARKGSYRTDCYPSPAPSWIPNAIKKTGDLIFNKVDNFFKGSDKNNYADCDGNPGYYRKPASNCIEWELNQDIVDIALCDIMSGFNCVIPGFIKNFAVRLHQITLLYLFTDLEQEELSREWFEKAEEDNSSKEFGKKKVIFNPKTIKVIIDARCLFINDWLKKQMTNFRIFLRLEQEKKTYYLLGCFTPQAYFNSRSDKNHIAQGPYKVKLYPALSYHKRI